MTSWRRTVTDRASRPGRLRGAGSGQGRGASVLDLSNQFHPVTQALLATLAGVTTMMILDVALG